MQVVAPPTALGDMLAFAPGEANPSDTSGRGTPSSILYSHPADTS